ncbi:MULTISPECIES: alanine racemase [unclassified Schlesneria]|uniref:alanine racemase n=1 Tax=unclassified Schlesneria TaxID=2762017 RepID=UPI002F12E700
MSCDGEYKSDVETPSLCLDLNRFEENLEKLQALLPSAGKSWRPQVAYHGTSQLAAAQLQAGAVGLTCGSVAEAEYFASCGFHDLLVTQSPVGSQRIRRIAALCGTTRLLVTCDHYVQAQSLSEECARQGVTCRVLVELNLGSERAGVRPGRDAIELGKGIARLPNLQLCGITGCESSSPRESDLLLESGQVGAALGVLAHARHMFVKNDLRCDTVSTSGTGAFHRVLASPAVTEIQAGNLVLGTERIFDGGKPEPLERALSLLATVVGRPSFERAVLDVGRTAMGVGSGLPVLRRGADARVLCVNSDHLVVALGPVSAEWRIGDRVELEVDVPPLTTPLHRQILCFRGERLEEVWPIHRHGNLI